MHGDKQHSAPQKYRDLALQEYGLPRSPELSWATMGIGVLLIFSLWGGPLASGLLQIMRAGLTRAQVEHPAAVDLSEIGQAWTAIVLACAGVLLGFWGLALFSQWVQGGWIWRPGSIRPRASRLLRNHADRSLVVANGMVSSALQLGRIAAVTTLAVLCCTTSCEQLFPHAASIVDDPLSQQLRALAAWLSSNATWIVAAYGVLGLADYVWRRWRWSRSMLLTPLEFRDVLRQLEGNKAIPKLSHRRRDDVHHTVR